MKRAFIITLLIGIALWLAGCEVVETHYVGRNHGFYGPGPTVIYQEPVCSPPAYYYSGHASRHGRARGYGHGRGHGW